MRKWHRSSQASLPRPRASGAPAPAGHALSSAPAACTWCPTLSVRGRDPAPVQAVRCMPARTGRSDSAAPVKSHRSNARKAFKLRRPLEFRTIPPLTRAITLAMLRRLRRSCDGDLRRHATMNPDKKTVRLRAATRGRSSTL